MKAMGTFSSQLLSENHTWDTIYTVPKNNQYSGTPTEWSLTCLDITKNNSGITLIYGEFDSAHCDMCFSINTKNYSVY